MKNKEFDVWIAENVMGWIIDPENVEGSMTFWHPTVDILDAFQVVEKMRITHFKWFEMTHRPNGYICNFVGDPHYTEFAKTAPLAICLAARKCIEGWNETK